MKKISPQNPQKLFTTAAVGLFLLTSVLHASLVSAHGGRNDECNDGNDIAPISENLATYTAPTGKIVSGVCIKAGNTPFGDGHSDVLGNGSYENGCFTISGVGTQTVVVTRNFSSNQCQGISHIDVYLGGTEEDPTNTPTLTPTDKEPTLTLTPTPTDEEEYPTNTPTATPTETEEYPTNTPSPTPEDDDGRNIDLTSTPTPTTTKAPTSTPTSGATATPTQGATGGGSNDTGSTNGSTSTSTVSAAAASTGQVLGATTLGDTGSFTELLSNILFYTGIVLISVAGISYGITKKRS